MFQVGSARIAASSAIALPLAPLPPGESLVERRVNGAALACREWGRSGQPLVLMIHGLSANSLSAEVEGRALASKGFHVVAPDLRGRNLSPATARGTLGWKQHAHDLLAVARQLRAKSFDVVGHSMGAYVAMEMAVQAPGCLRRVVLVDGLGHIEAGAWKAVVASPNRLGKEYESADAYVGALLARGIPPAWARSFREELEHLPGGKVRPRTDREAVLEDLRYTGRELARPAVFPSHYWRALPDDTLVVRAALPLVAQQGDVIRDSDLRLFRAQRPRASFMTAAGTNHYSVFTDTAAAKRVVDFVTR